MPWRALLAGPPHDTPHDAPQVSPQVEALLAALSGEISRGMSRQELQDSLGLSDRESFRKAYLLPALEAGLVEMTLPDRPRSRLQRYRLSLLGRKVQQRL